MKRTTSPAMARLLMVLILATLASGDLHAARAARDAARDAGRDAAAELLSRDGGVVIGSAGPFVTTGTYRVQVSRKLGRPDLTLADGTWLYHNHRITDSIAKGTLVVHFKDGRVSSLALVSADVVAVVKAEEQRYKARVAATK